MPRLRLASIGLKMHLWFQSLRVDVLGMLMLRLKETPVSMGKVALGRLYPPQGPMKILRVLSMNLCIFLIPCLLSG